MNAFEILSEKKHEKVSVFHDRKTGLHAIIAVHDSSIGPGLGGCRLRAYRSIEEAMVDVLYLSEGMTYKNALGGITFGGGKSVIIGDRDMTEGRRELFLSFGRCIESLGGSYVSAEDMGTCEEDMSTIAEETEYVTGCHPAEGGAGDPSPYTARGLFQGMRACLERAYGSDDFSGRHIVIQGVGNVGFYLGELLRDAGARMTVADTRSDRLQEVASELGAETASVENVFSVECDVFAPCAVGQVINPDTVEKLQCKIVAGGANNQIHGEGVVQRLQERNILYAPDFAINAGGVIAVGDEREAGGFTKSRVDERIARIYQTVGKILDQSQASGQLSGAVALSLAMSRIEQARAARSS